MLGLAWPEILLIGTVAVIAIGPKDLPKVMRQLGVWSHKLRAMTDAVRNELHALPHHADLEAMQKEVEALQKAGFRHFNVSPEAFDKQAPAAAETRMRAAYGEPEGGPEAVMRPLPVPAATALTEPPVEPMSGDDALATPPEHS